MDKKNIVGLKFASLCSFPFRAHGFSKLDITTSSVQRKAMAFYAREGRTMPQEFRPDEMIPGFGYLTGLRLALYEVDV